MRLTGGRLRGRSISGGAIDGVRPTSARVREALFSMVGHQLEGWSVLDACGGSGILGFEAHSRGAEVTIVDLRRRVVNQIRATSETLGVEVKIQCANAKSVLNTGTWDLVLLDPPYRDDPEEWLDHASEAVKRTLVIEHAAQHQLPQTAKRLTLRCAKRYGGTALSVYDVAQLPNLNQMFNTVT